MESRDFVEEFELAINVWSNGDIIACVEKASDDDLYEFVETLALISKYHFVTNRNDANESFSFVANSSLSGGKHPCSYAACRNKRIEDLVSFASLYADEVYILNPFEEFVLGETETFNELMRLEIVASISTFLQLKPLFKLGLIKYAHSMVTLCEHHSATLAQPLLDRIQTKSNQLRSFLFNYLIERVEIKYDEMESGLPFLHIHGPENLIEHGGIYLHLYGPNAAYFEDIRGKTLPYAFSRSEIIDLSLLELVIEPIVEDLSRQEWHTSFFGTSYLCDNETELKLASQLNPEPLKANANAFQSTMQHYLPSLVSNDVSIITDLRIRENDAFKVYRDRLKSLIGSNSNWTEAQLAEVVRDDLLPEINLIEKRVSDWKSNLTSNLQEKILFSTGAIAIGLYAGILPPSLGQILAAAGGGTAAVGALMDFNKTSKEKEEARKNDFYFLWQARKQGGST